MSIPKEKRYLLPDKPEVVYAHFQTQQEIDCGTVFVTRPWAGFGDEQTYMASSKVLDKEGLIAYYLDQIDRLRQE